MSRLRLNPEHRRKIIVSAAVDLAKRTGFDNIASPERVSNHCRISTSVATIRRYFPSTIDLMRAAADADEWCKIEFDKLDM